MLFSLALHLADDALLLGHRNSEWTGHGPNLEQDIAISNIALDLIGQARMFYQYAAELQNASATDGTIIDEDDLAYLRDVPAFKNHLLVELNKGDWAFTILRQFLFSVYQQLLYKGIQSGSDQRLAAIAEKALKEVNYHVRWSGEWVIRLGDGTEESNRRITTALAQIWSYTGEFFMPAPFQLVAGEAGWMENPTGLKQSWLETVRATFKQATLEIPNENYIREGGKSGVHTEHLGFLLAEMQYLQRTYPASKW